MSLKDLAKKEDKLTFKIESILLLRQGKDLREKKIHPLFE